MVAAAREGREEEVGVRGEELGAHCALVVEAAEVACSVCPRGEGVRMARCAAGQLQALCPQVPPGQALDLLEAKASLWSTSVS